MTTRYTIMGSSTTRPADLPEGFTVEETYEVFKKYIDSGQSDDWSLYILETVLGRSMVFTPTDADGSSQETVILSEEAVRNLRDTLTTWLDTQEFVGRVYLDGEGDEWHETEPDRFTYISPVTKKLATFHPWSVNRLLSSLDEYGEGHFLPNRVALKR